MGAYLGPVLGLSHSHHRAAPVTLLAGMSAESAIVAASLALQYRVLWRRQAENADTGLLPAEAAEVPESMPYKRSC
jgi:hypothetical protein